MRNNMFSLAIAGVRCVVYLYFFGFRAAVEIDIDFPSKDPNFFQIYWADHEQEYSEKRMQKVLITGYRQHYRMFLTNLSNVEKLRNEPLHFSGQVKLKRFSISQLGYESDRAGFKKRLFPA